MKFLFLIAALCVLTVSADDASYKAEICFKKVTKCCYKYKKCDYIEKKIPVKKRCDFKKCKLECKNIKICKNVCKQVKVRVPKKVCVPVYKNVCKRVKNKYGFWHKKCEKVKSGKKCKTKYVYIWKEICKRVCKNKKKCKKMCHKVKAYCVYYKTVKFAKYCPKIKCFKEVIVDKKKTPKDIISKKAIFVSKTASKRKIVGKKHK